jgi:hypothetical protein
MTEFKDFDIDLAIKDSKNLKAVGTDGIYLFWLKKCNCPTVTKTFQFNAKKWKCPNEF